MSITALALAVAFSSPAEAKSSDIPIEISFDHAVYSKYVWRGINLSNGGVYQPSVTVGYERFKFNIWGSYELTDSVNYPSGSNGKNRFTEWDSTLSYTGDCNFGSWTVGAIQYAYPTTGLATTTEAFAQIDFNHDLNPYIAAYLDLDESEGAYFRLGGSKNLNPEGSIPVDLNFWVGYGDKKNNDFSYGNNRAGLADYGIEAKFTKSAGQGELWASVGFTGLFDSKHLQGNDNRSNFIVGFGYGIKF